MNYELADDTWNQEEYNAIRKVMDSGLFTMGKLVAEYEKRFAEKMKSKYAVMCNSGSSANLLAIAAMAYSGKLQKGDEVIVPAVSWSTTYFPLAQYQLKLKFVDIDKMTLNYNLDMLKEAISTNTKAVICVNLLGNPNDYDKIIEMCAKKNIVLLEDNCEALGGKYKKNYLGTFGEISSFSTYYSHHLCTMEGGIALTNSKELYEYMLCIRAHGWTRNLTPDSKIYKKREDSFYEKFNFIMPGFNLRPLEIEAAAGICQLDKMDQIILSRRENAKTFLDKMESSEKYYVQKEIGTSSWFGFSLVLKEKYKGKRDLVVKQLQEKNIEIRPIVAGNFTRNDAIKYVDYSIFDEIGRAHV